MKIEQGLPKSTRMKLADTVEAGAALWAMGYAIGMALFAFIPAGMIGLIVLPIMVPVTVYVAVLRLKGGESISYILVVAATWTSIAIVFDYVFLIYSFNVQNYYDLDVMIYYVLTFLIPALVGVRYRKS